MLSSAYAPQRLQVDNRLQGGIPSTIAEDVRQGLTAHPRSLPPKYFYDDHGSHLFDLICDQPEYYPTRTEQRLLEVIAGPLMSRLRPTDLVELGSGSGRKTRLLIDAAGRANLPLRYVPVDVNEAMIRRSATAFLADFPWLNVHAVVGDYEHHLRHVPPGQRRLVAYLGGTLGNFLEPAACRFLRGTARMLQRGDHLLLGADLVKDVDVLNRAYNDAAGVTARFNRNILRVINRELDGDFDLEAFEHDAFYRTDAAQIEMHLRALSPQRVRLRRIDLEVRFEAGETICTEVSRKFTRSSLTRLLEASGFRLREWHTPADDAFALALAEVTGEWS